MVGKTNIVLLTSQANLVPGSSNAQEPVLLIVIIPVYNKKRTTDKFLRRVLVAPYYKEVIVVNDGLTDGTRAVLEKWKGDPRVVVLHHSCNQAKGKPIRTALVHAQGKFTLIQDANLEYEPQDYPRLIETLSRGEAQVVYGSRYLLANKGEPHPWRVFGYGVVLLNFSVRILYGARLTDEATCYKAFATSLLKAIDLQCDRFDFCPEVTAKACRLGLNIQEVPIHYHFRGLEAGKKIR